MALTVLYLPHSLDGELRSLSRNPIHSSNRNLGLRGDGGWKVSPSLVGPVDPSFRALSGRLKFTVRRHKFNTDSILLGRWRLSDTKVL